MTMLKENKSRAKAKSAMSLHFYSHLHSKSSHLTTSISNKNSDITFLVGFLMQRKVKCSNNMIIQLRYFTPLYCFRIYWGKRVIIFMFEVHVFPIFQVFFLGFLSTIFLVLLFFHMIKLCFKTVALQVINVNANIEFISSSCWF